MGWRRFSTICCVVLLAIMTSSVSAGGKRNYFYGYGGPQLHFVKYANTRHYYGLGHSVSNYPPYWLYDTGKKGGGRRRGGGKKRGGGSSVVVINHNSYGGGHGGGYGGGGGHGGGYGGGGGHGGGGDGGGDFDYYDDLY